MNAIRILLIAASLMVAGVTVVAAQDASAVPAQDKAAVLARVKLLEEQIQTLQIELQTLKASLAPKEQGAITVSIDPQLKSAEPLPEVTVQRRSAAKRKALAKAYK